MKKSDITAQESFDPSNEVIQTTAAARLHEIVQERCKENTANISAKVTEILDVAFNVSADKEKREEAMINLLVLASDKDGAEEIFKRGGVSKIAQLVKEKKQQRKKF